MVNIATVEELTCIDTIVILDASNSSQGGTFSASWNGIGIDGNSEFVQTINNPGTYELVVTNTDNGCTQSASVTVAENVQPPVFSVDGNRFLSCETGTTELNIQFSAPINQFSIVWTDPDGSTISNAELDRTLDQTGTYTILITDLINGCSSLETLSIASDPGGPTNALFEIENPTCFGEDNGTISILSVIGGVEPFVFSFDNDNFSTSNQIGRLVGGTYPISIQDANGCSWSTEISLIEPNQFVVDLGSDEEILLGDSLRLNGEFSNPVDTFFWNDPSFLSCVNCTNPFARPVNTTQVILTAIDTNGCESSDVILLSVDKERNVFIPSAFSPNGDGVNDRFTVLGGNGIQEIEFIQVFNRWGALVFEQKEFPPNATPLGWDGTFNGEPAETGVYVFQVNVIFVDGFEKFYQGDVTILR